MKWIFIIIVVSILIAIFHSQIALGIKNGCHAAFD
jgi:hypothetical protein